MGKSFSHILLDQARQLRGAKFRCREWFHIIIAAFIAAFLHGFFKKIESRLSLYRDRWAWEAKIEPEEVQACLLLTVNTATCGRVEKRTLCMMRFSDMFNNDYLRNMVREAADKTTDENPFILQHLNVEERWHILNIALNHLSSVFGPYHLFSQQVSSYESSWYVMSLVGTRTDAAGRFFITPRRRVLDCSDVGVRRIRIVLVNEDELRRICHGDIDLVETFSQRHKSRWNIMQSFASLFVNQMRCVLQPEGEMDVLNQSWGYHFCGTLMRVSNCNVREEDAKHINNFLRIHIPIPLVQEAMVKRSPFFSSALS